jgi:oligoendopeptidase F
MDSLVLLETNLHQLLNDYQQLQEQARMLKEENLRKQADLEQAYADLHQLRQDYKRLEAAHAMVASNALNDAERIEAKKRLTSIISQIDRALEVLKQ